MRNPATPKQIAFLTFMGVKNASSMTFEQASNTIENLDESVSDRDFEKYLRRKGEWIQQRFILYPDLYQYELKTFIINELPETLHNYVRSRVKGASERLTKTKIRQVINKLGRENADWWKEPNFREVFFGKLSEMHPGCTDGIQPITPPPLPRQQEHHDSYLKPVSRRSGCMVVLAIALSFPIAILLVKVLA